MTPLGGMTSSLAGVDGDAAGGQCGEFVGVVGEEPDAGQAEGLEHGGGDEKVAFVGLPAEGAVGVDGVEAAILQGVGAQFAGQADAAGPPGRGR